MSTERRGQFPILPYRERHRSHLPTAVIPAKAGTHPTCGESQCRARGKISHTPRAHGIVDGRDQCSGFPFEPNRRPGWAPAFAGVTEIWVGKGGISPTSDIGNRYRSPDLSRQPLSPPHNRHPRLRGNDVTGGVDRARVQRDRGDHRGQRADSYTRAASRIGAAMPG